MVESCPGDEILRIWITLNKMNEENEDKVWELVNIKENR